MRGDIVDDGKTLRLDLKMEQTNDISTRAQQATAVQNMVGQIVAQLLTHGKPLAVQLEIHDGIGINVGGTATRDITLELYWQEIEGDETPVMLVMPKRCLKCGDLMMTEVHECKSFGPPLNPDANEEVVL
ncbi:MAG: hypothetical protein KAJ73_08945 [Zetaproteobacteria bacterium]|nr:hypothetical protein [Zetaproteobacteria bacterium]